MRDEGNAQAAAISAAQQRIASTLTALGDETSPTFWSMIQGDSALPLEVLVKTVRRFQKQGRAVEVLRVAEPLLNRVYPIIEGMVRKQLSLRPVEEREQAVQDTCVTMWRHISDGTPFWEENCLHALFQACATACRHYRSKTHRMLDAHVSDVDRVTEDIAADTDARAAGDATDQTDADHRAEGATLTVTRAAAPRLALRSPVETAVLRREDARRGRAVYEDILARLSDGEAALLRLLFEEGLSQTEASKRLGCTAKTVYNRLQRIRAVTDAYRREERDGDE